MSTQNVTLVPLADARRRVGISRKRFYRLLRNRGVTPIRVGAFGFVPLAVVEDIERANRAWRKSDDYKKWFAKFGHQWSATR